MKNRHHDMQALGYLLNRWGRQLELMRFWHGFPTIEATYRAFFGPGAFTGGRLPIPDIEADIIMLNLRILALRDHQQKALMVFYGFSTKPAGGYFSDTEKAAALGSMLKLAVSETELRFRVNCAKKQLLTNLTVVVSPNLANCHSKEAEVA